MSHPTMNHTLLVQEQVCQPAVLQYRTCESEWVISPLGCLTGDDTVTPKGDGHGAVTA